MSELPPNVVVDLVTAESGDVISYNAFYPPIEVNAVETPFVFYSAESVGATGLTGPVGPKGDTGTRGTIWFNGAGAPPNPIPGSMPGDYYLNTTNGDVYVVS